MSHFHLTYTTRSVPSIPFATIKDHILGPKYELTLALIGRTRAKALNQRSRGKSYTPNVLSFPLTKTTGEIYLCPAVAAREASAFGRTTTAQLTFLFIHGLLHLKGYDHGATMERLEEQWCKTFKCSPAPEPTSI